MMVVKDDIEIRFYFLIDNHFIITCVMTNIGVYIFERHPRENRQLKQHAVRIEPISQKAHSRTHIHTCIYNDTY
jgi:hypothetical protein